MKPFDLKLALAGHPVCTRDGSEVLEIMTVPDEYILITDQPIIALVKDSATGEVVTNTYNINGKWYDDDVMNCDDEDDLVMMDTRKIKTRKIIIVEYMDPAGYICEVILTKFNLITDAGHVEISRREIEIDERI